MNSCRFPATFLAWKHHGVFCVVNMRIDLCMFDWYNPAIYITLRFFFFAETGLRHGNQPLPSVLVFNVETFLRSVQKTRGKTCLDCIDLKSWPVYITFEVHNCLIYSSLYCKACMPGKYEKCCFPAGSHRVLSVFFYSMTLLRLSIRESNRSIK